MLFSKTTSLNRNTVNGSIWWCNAQSNNRQNYVSVYCMYTTFQKGRKKASKGLTLLNMEIEFQVAIQLTITIFWP